MNFSKRLIDGSTGKAYFVLVKLFKHLDDSEGSSFDLSVTDGSKCWFQTGVRRPANTRLPQWMQKATEALTDTSNTDKFTYDFAEDKGASLKLTWNFYLDEAGQHAKSSLLVPAAADCPQVLRELLDVVLHNVAVLQGSVSELQGQAERLRGEAQRAQQQIDTWVKTSEQREEQLYIKFAAVLNEKKLKANEWKQRAEQAEAALQKSTKEDAGDAGTPSGTDDDDAYSGATDPSEASAPDDGHQADHGAVDNEDTRSDQEATTKDVADSSARVHSSLPPQDTAAQHGNQHDAVDAPESPRGTPQHAAEEVERIADEGSGQDPDSSAAWTDAATQPVPAGDIPTHLKHQPSSHDPAVAVPPSDSAVASEAGQRAARPRAVAKRRKR